MPISRHVFFCNFLTETVYVFRVRGKTTLVPSSVRHGHRFVRRRACACFDLLLQAEIYIQCVCAVRFLSCSFEKLGEAVQGVLQIQADATANAWVKTYATFIAARLSPEYLAIAGYLAAQFRTPF